MKEYTPELSIVKRKKEGIYKGTEHSFWVNMPHGPKFNIWDLSKKEITPNVKQALKHAFELGFSAHSILVNKVPSSISFEISEE